jgi:hypothetical protein
MQRFDAQLAFMRKEEQEKLGDAKAKAKAENGERAEVKTEVQPLRLRLNFKVENHPRFPSNYLVTPSLRYGG